VNDRLTEADLATIEANIDISNGSRAEAELLGMPRLVAEVRRLRSLVARSIVTEVADEECPPLAVDARAGRELQAEARAIRDENP
jgi:hypothetical protein